MPKKKDAKESVKKWSKGITDAGAEKFDAGVADAIAEDKFAKGIEEAGDIKWAMNTAAAVASAGKALRWSTEAKKAASEWATKTAGKGADWLKSATSKNAATRYVEAVGKIIEEVTECEGDVSDADVQAYRRALLAAGGDAEKRAETMSLDALKGDLVRMCLSGKAKAGKLKATTKKK